MIIWVYDVRTCKFWFTLAVVGVDSVHTGATVLALVARTVVDVVVAVFSCKSYKQQSTSSKQHTYLLHRDIFTMYRYYYCYFHIFMLSVQLNVINCLFLPMEEDSCTLLRSVVTLP